MLLALRSWSQSWLASIPLICVKHPQYHRSYWRMSSFPCRPETRRSAWRYPSHFNTVTAATHAQPLHCVMARRRTLPQAPFRHATNVKAVLASLARMGRLDAKDNGKTFLLRRSA